jgi:DNA processing protein
MVRAFTALAHVASQLLHRWLPPPEGGAGGPEPEELTLGAWRDLVRSPEAAAALPWLPRYLAIRDVDGAALAAAVHAHLSAAAAAGATYLTRVDAAYPPLLGATRDAPQALTLLGEASLLARPAVAVVGSRKASALAVQASFAVGRALAAAGALVVSGGAFGCDLAAHHGVLATGLAPAPGACVFACGLEQLYPRANAAVFRRLAERRGILLTERLWSAACRPPDFPVRNRIIAGLAAATVVMQAAERSGAMVTARLALDRGRDVLVLRHPVGDVRAAGGEGLLADGAAAFASADELLDLLGFSSEARA